MPGVVPSVSRADPRGGRSISRHRAGLSGLWAERHPCPSKYAYTFERISKVIEGFLARKGFDRYGVFVQDYGGPVGFRIVGRRPEALEWLIIQNSNAYEIGFTPAWDGLRGRSG